MFLKRFFLLLFMLIFISFLYISFAYIFNINRMFFPDFWFLMVIFIGYYLATDFKLLIVFFMGILKDVFEIGVFGSSAFLFVVIVFFLNDIFNKLYKDNVLNIFVVIFLLSIFYYFFKYLLYIMFGFDVVFSFEYILKSIINSLVAPFLFNIILKINEWFDYVAK